MTSPCTCLQHDDPRTGRLERLELCQQHQPPVRVSFTEEELKQVEASKNKLAHALYDLFAAYVGTEKVGDEK